jgi:hypothetical protein
MHGLFGSKLTEWAKGNLLFGCPVGVWIDIGSNIPKLE